MENIRRISKAAKRPDTIPESTPRLNIRGDRYAPLNFSIERTKQRRNPMLIWPSFYSSSKRPDLVLSLYPGSRAERNP